MTQPDLNDFFPGEPEYPKKVETEWHEDLIVVKVDKYRLGIELDLPTLKTIVEVLEFTQMLSEIQRDQMSDDLARIVLSMEGRE